MPNYDWVANPTRALETGGLYRVGIVVPATMSEDDAIAALTARGWVTTSLSVPEPNVAQALKNLASVGLGTPNAWRVIAHWNAASTTLGDREGSLFYGPLDQWSVVPNVSPRRNPSSLGPSSVLPSLLGFVFGAAAVVVAVRLFQSRSLAPSRARARMLHA